MIKKISKLLAACSLLIVFSLFVSIPVSLAAGCFGPETLRLNTLTSSPRPLANTRFLVEAHGLVNDDSYAYAMRFYDAAGKRPPVNDGPPNSPRLYYVDKYPDWELDLGSGGLTAGTYRFELLRGRKVGPVILGVNDLCAAITVTVDQASGAQTNPPINNVATGLGPVTSDLGQLVNQIFGLALGMAGGIAILRIIIGGFKVAASGGDPKALDDGRAIITSSVVGLLFILLAAVILSIIGVNILGLSGFAKQVHIQ